MSAATLLHANDPPSIVAAISGAAGTPAATADFPAVYSFRALTLRDPNLPWRFALLTLLRAPESWLQSENPAHERRFSRREQDRRLLCARQSAKRERNRDATFTISATATQTEQAR